MSIGPREADLRGASASGGNNEQSPHVLNLIGMPEILRVRVPVHLWEECFE